MSENTDMYNADELEPPQWLNTDFFNNVLRNYLQDANLKILSLKITPGTMKGDHYGSAMFRIALIFEQKGVKHEKCLIIKTFPEAEHKQDVFEESHTFETEILIYRDVIPNFVKTLESIGDNMKFGPNCLHASIEPKKCLVFDDLVKLGYVLLRDREANITESRLALLKLAKWHALGFKLIKDGKAKMLDKFRYSMFSLKNLVADDYFQNGITHFINMLGGQPVLLEYKLYFEKIRPNLIEKCLASFNEFYNGPQDGSLYALCHGDFHFKNMMFKYNPKDGSLEDDMILDYQFSHVGPMVNDLNYAFIMLWDKEQRLHHFDGHLRYYFDNLLDTLKKIGYKGELPTFENLKDQFLRQKYYVFFMLTTFLPMWRSFYTGDSEPVMTSAEYRKNCYKQQYLIDEIHELLPLYKKFGYFDDL
ncbi:uncharacterized protein LOC119674588 [Teleopsis dalmanni]|uniref:uncharacterized protein LOC119674588 n=1 Tax=Teleopsis dalmanni TaxID=139649 RepID=UPI000D32BC93|nr:uncharacterized protein LOC119674588 [Teleopsis dalmanni]